MPVQNVEDLFLYDMSAMYDAEHRILQMLGVLANEVDDDQFRGLLQDHERETRHQIQNLERCFELIRIQPQRVTCYEVEGIKQDHDSIARENPPEHVVTMADLGGTIKTELFEIASYRSLVDKAEKMGLRNCTRLLRENLSQEENMARRCEDLDQRMNERFLGEYGRRAA